MTGWTETPMADESCCCGATLLIRETQVQVRREVRQQFRDAHAACREAWAKAQNDSVDERDTSWPWRG